MNAKVWGALAASASLILAAFGVTDPNINGAVQGVIAGAAGLVTIVTVIQHHKTTRNADTAAANSVRPVVVSPPAGDLMAAVETAVHNVLTTLGIGADETGKHDAQEPTTTTQVQGSTHV